MRLYVERGWIKPEDAVRAGDEFPSWQSSAWHTFAGPREQGKQEGSASIAGPLTEQLHHSLSGAGVVRWLAGIFHQPTLCADPERIGGGVHQIAPGGRLALHQDFNVHPLRPDLVRSVNVILFVSEPGISDRDPGALVLYDGNQHVRIAPEPGTLVAFSAEARTWHGHPEPLRDDQPRRRSIPAYYYRPIRQLETVVARSTTWLDCSDSA